MWTPQEPTRILILMGIHILKKAAIILASIGFALAVIEGLCALALHFNMQRENFHIFSGTGQPEHSEGDSALGSSAALRMTGSSYKYEIAVQIKNYPKVFSEFYRTFTHDFENTSGYREFFEDMFYALPNYSGYEDFFVGADKSLARHVKVSTDELGRRHTHLPSPQDNERHRHLILMGCSFTFGDGLGDDETLGWWMHHMQNEQNVYNMSFSSYNPALTYRMIEHSGWFEKITPASGMALYLLLPFHIDRFLAQTQVLIPDGYPYYTGSPGNYKFVGAHRSLTTLYGRLQALYAGSSFYQLFQVALPPVTAQSYKKMAQMLKEIERTYYKTFQSEGGSTNKFVVVLYPYPSSGADHTRWLKEALESEQIYFVDFSSYDLQEYTNESVTLPDAHPSNAGNKVFAPMLLDQIQAMTSAPE